MRARIRAWTIAAYVATLAAFTLAGILEERRQARATETFHADALLDHLRKMPQFSGTAPDAQSAVAALNESLRTVGGRLELARMPPGGRESLREVAAERRVELTEGVFALRYDSDPGRLASITRRAVAMHSVHALVALAALLAGTEWILRRYLVNPLRALSHQIDLIREGRGWTVRLPSTDEELEALSGALDELGPGLERQVREWIEAERRSAVALILVAVRVRLRQTTRRVLSLLRRLESPGDQPPADSSAFARALRAEIEALPCLPEIAARHVFETVAGHRSAAAQPSERAADPGTDLGSRAPSSATPVSSAAHADGPRPPR
jgi:hypothetical protein